MKTRNTDTPKSGPTKKTPVKKTTEKTPPKPSEPSNDSAPPKSAPSTAPKQAKNVASAKTSTPKAASKPESKVEGSKEASTPKTASKTESKVEGSSASVTPEVKVVQKAKPVAKRTPGKTTKSPSVKSASAKTPKSVKSASAKTPKSGESVKLEVEQSSKKEEEEEPDVSNDVGSLKKEEPIVVNVDESPKKEEPIIANMVESSEKEVPTVPEVVESSENEKREPEPASVEEEEEEYVEADEDTNEPEPEPEPEAEGDLVKMEEDTKKDKEVEGDRPDDEELNANDGMEDYNEQEGFEEPGDEEIAEDDASDPDEEAAGLEAENMEISALAKERRIKKEQEIFVGGLDRDAVEDDIKKAFEKIGEVVEVRLHRNPLTNKNKGYAFVKFVDKEHATRALSELKNPIIRGKRCGVASSEDNDTLFVGNICNTWTKEAIKQKLKEYGLEGVENITLVADARHEGLSRGFAFVEFSCHADAMLAYKRLQKPDVIFGHAERTVKVAFAEPLREPDPEIMAHVKSVFVDGLPPHWDEEHVREHFKGYGEIERIVLARNMPTAKRKDFGFVDFTTHEAAIACINGVNNTELGDEKSKTKVKVRLASPLPKTQAVKGGLCGGFRIGHANSGFARFGRGFARGGRPFNRGNFQRGKDFHARGRGRAGRFAFGGDNDLEGPYSGFRGRQPFGGRGGRMEYGKDFSSRPATSSRSDLGRSRHGAFERGRGKAIQSRREPFQSEGHYGRPFGGRHFVDDPYLYDDSGYGVKRPFSAMDYEPGYLEPSRQRPRFDHLDPIVSSRRSHYQDSFGAGSGLYSHDYYGSDYGGSAYSSMYGGDSSYGSGYYY